MDLVEARRIIESLRKGIPPDGFIRHFTVGRASEISKLTESLDEAIHSALLLKANYGAGKTHILRFIRESALEKNYAVSSVTLDCKGEVRFNRMDQVLGAICRNIEIPGISNQKGIRTVFNYVSEKLEYATNGQNNTFWQKLTNNGRWDFSDVLDSPALFVAIRAWAWGNSKVEDRIEDWVLQPWLYYNQKSILYTDLVLSLRQFFLDPRPMRQFYSDGVFLFHTQGYAQSWSALRDIQRLLCASGLKGLVLLFDEFEDVVTNLRNIAYQESAVRNLFQFYSGKQYPGLSFFAVTPEFVNKCITLFINKGRYEYNYNALLKTIPTFQMTPLDVEELEELAMRILETHGIAYNWKPDSLFCTSKLDEIVSKAASAQIQDRARLTIIAVVKALDRLLEENE